MKVYLTVQRLSYAYSKRFTDVVPRKHMKVRKRGQRSGIITIKPTTDPGYQSKSDTFTIRHTNESQEVSPFQAGDHKASINRRARKHNKNKTEKMPFKCDKGSNFSCYKFEQKSHTVYSLRYPLPTRSE